MLGHTEGDRCELTKAWTKSQGGHVTSCSSTEGLETGWVLSVKADASRASDSHVCSPPAEADLARQGGQHAGLGARGRGP